MAWGVFWWEGKRAKIVLYVNLLTSMFPGRWYAKRGDGAADAGCEDQSCRGEPIAEFGPRGCNVVVILRLLFYRTSSLERQPYLARGSSSAGARLKCARAIFLLASEVARS